MKALQLLSLLPRRPAEFIDRTSAIITSRWESVHLARPRYEPVYREQAQRSLSAAMGCEISDCFDEPALVALENAVSDRRERIPAEAPFGAFHDGDSLLGRLCYSIVRALKPTAIVETGVCYGVTSSYMLEALNGNRSGFLHSIDLPPLAKNGDDYVGWLVPQKLRARWSLHRGTSNRLLPSLLAELGQIDLFVHDSLHTYRNMTKEFDVAWPALRPGGVLISDDIEGNKAFQELSLLWDVAASVVIKEEDKDSLLGIAVKTSR